MKNEINGILNIDQIKNQANELLRKAKALEKAQANLNKLDAMRNQLLRQADAIMAGEVKAPPTVAKSPNARVAPRGVLTLAILEAMANEKQLTVTEIVQRVRQDKRIPNVNDLEHRIRNLVHTSTRFNRVGKGLFRAKGVPKDALFKRLTREELVAA